MAPLGAVMRDAPWEAAVGCMALRGSVLLARSAFGRDSVLPSPLMWVLGYRARAVVTEPAGALGVVYTKNTTRGDTVEGRRVGGTTWIEEAHTERARQPRAAWGTAR